MRAAYPRGPRAAQRLARRLALALAIAALLAAAPRPAPAAGVVVVVQSAGGAPLSGAVVFLESAEARAAARPAAQQEISQVDRRFVPEVLVVPVGTEVRFPNRDKVRHHVYSFSPAKPFELKLYAGTPANPVLFDRSGIVVLGCNIHDTMTGWVVVVETPYFARSAAGGQASLADVPAGRYRLRVWHAELPPGTAASEQPLVVGAQGASARVTLAGVQP